MTNGLNIQLPEELRYFIDQQLADEGLYNTPSELIGDLIRKHKETTERQERQRITDMLIAVRQRNEYYETDGRFFTHIQEEIDRRHQADD